MRKKKSDYILIQFPKITSRESYSKGKTLCRFKTFQSMFSCTKQHHNYDKVGYSEDTILGRSFKTFMVWNEVTKTANGHVRER